VAGVNWAHLHLAVNHIPVLGTLLIFVLLCVAMLRRSDELKKVGLCAFVVLAIVSVVIKFTRDFAFQAAAKLTGWKNPSWSGMKSARTRRRHNPPASLAKE
jgi:predicted PurR-regulated permease PerM